MSEGTKYRPKRHLRHEIYSLMAVLSAPLVLAFVFPYKAIGFKPAAEPARAVPSCAFVTLSQDETDAAIAAARAAIRTSSDTAGRLRADLSLWSIPDDDSLAVAELSDRRGVGPIGNVYYHARLLPPTAAAAAPEKIAPQTDAPVDKQLPFSREDLLAL